MSTQTILTGHIAIEAQLHADTREIASIHVDRDQDWRKLEPLRRAAKARGLALEPMTREQLDELAEGGAHGGVVARVGERRFLTLEQLLEGTGRERSFLAMLDGVEDPFNFGQAVRSLYAAGCHGLVVRPRNWTTAAATVARSSAGTSELMPMAVSESVEEACAFFAERKLSVTVTAEEDERAVSLDEADLTGPLFLVLGGERRGVKRSVMDSAAAVVRIPYGREFGLSLGTVAATSVLAFEVRRQRAAAKAKRR